jgi:hypothetical protein
MQSLPEIQAAIAQLPLQDVHKLADWLSEYLAIAADMAPAIEPESLTLTEKLQQARAEIKARREAHYHHE